MYVCKWLFNLFQILEKILIKDRVFEVDINKDFLLIVKILGIMWFLEEDVFMFKVNLFEENFQIIKWNFLKKIVILFDLVGFLVLFIIWVKVMMQEMWVVGFEWDELCLRELIYKF